MWLSEILSEINVVIIHWQLLWLNITRLCPSNFHLWSWQSKQSISHNNNVNLSNPVFRQRLAEKIEFFRNRHRLMITLSRAIHIYPIISYHWDEVRRGCGSYDEHTDTQPESVESKDLKTWIIIRSNHPRPIFRIWRGTAVGTFCPFNVPNVFANVMVQ